MNDNDATQAGMAARLARQGHREQDMGFYYGDGGDEGKLIGRTPPPPPSPLRPGYEERGLQAPAHVRTPHHTRHKTTRPGMGFWQGLGAAVRGVNVPVPVVAATRGVLAAGFTIVAEVAMTKAGLLPPGTWQAALPAFVGVVRLLEGSVLDWGKSNT